MAAVSRQGDTVLSRDGGGYRNAYPMQTYVGETNGNGVFANGKEIVVNSNMVLPHPSPNETIGYVDRSVLTTSSESVFIGRKGIGRIGDQFGPSNIITQGSLNVFSK